MAKDSLSSREMGDLATGLVNALRMQQNASDRLDEASCKLFGIGRTDGRCLDILDRAGRLTAGQLGTEAGLTSGAVTALIDRLERAGYLRRAPDPGDRRKVWIEPTERVRAISADVYGRVTEIGASLLASLTEADLRLVTRFLLVSAEMNNAIAARLDTTLENAAPGTPPEALARDFSARLENSAAALLAEMEELGARHG